MTKSHNAQSDDEKARVTGGGGKSKNASKKLNVIKIVSVAILTVINVYAASIVITNRDLVHEASTNNKIVQAKVEEVKELVNKAVHREANTTSLMDESLLVADSLPNLTFLVILKTPRSGSTYLKEILTANPNIDLLWEERPSRAGPFFEKCKKRWGMSDTRKVCAYSANNYLNSRIIKNNYDVFNSLIKDYNATVAIQVRANAVERAISALRKFEFLKPSKGDLFRGIKKKRITPNIAEKIRVKALKLLETPRAYVGSEKFIPSTKPPIWLWYEDLVRYCDEKIHLLYGELGLPAHESIEKLCSESHFLNETYNDYLVSSLNQEPSLRPMIDSRKFNMELNTNELYDKYKKETEAIDEPMHGFWR